MRSSRQPGSVARALRLAWSNPVNCIKVSRTPVKRCGAGPHFVTHRHVGYSQNRARPSESSVFNHPLVPNPRDIHENVQPAGHPIDVSKHIGDGLVVGVVARDLAAAARAAADLVTKVRRTCTVSSV